MSPIAKTSGWSAKVRSAVTVSRPARSTCDPAEDASAVVKALETQYDAAAGSLIRKSLLADSTPSADELGAEVEQFLAELNREDND